ncbi:hypothetical protein VTI74DRAFT_5348 [Chaetomium olivicolor]
MASGHKGCASILIHHGATLERGDSALRSALINNDDEGAAMLLRHGAWICSVNRTASLVAQRGPKHVARFLSHHQSAETLVCSLLGLAEAWCTPVLDEFFTSVPPLVSAKVSRQLASSEWSPESHIVKMLLESRPSTSGNMPEMDTKAIQGLFAINFIPAVRLLAITRPETLKDYLAGMPSSRIQAYKALRQSLQIADNEILQRIHRSGMPINLNGVDNRVRTVTHMRVETGILAAF